MKQYAPTKELRARLTVSGTLILALILTLLPMPTWLAWFRPSWVCLILIFWAMTLSSRLIITLAWLMGLFLDVLNGSLLGEHALALTIVISCTAKLSNQLRMYSLMQQALAVFVLVLLYEFILFCIQGFLGNLSEGWLHWLPALTSMLLWPGVFIIMRDWHRRFKVDLA